MQSPEDTLYIAHIFKDSNNNFCITLPDFGNSMIASYSLHNVIRAGVRHFNWHVNELKRDGLPLPKVKASYPPRPDAFTTIHISTNHQPVLSLKEDEELDLGIDQVHLKFETPAQAFKWLIEYHSGESSQYAYSNNPNFLQIDYYDGLPLRLWALWENELYELCLVSCNPPFRFEHSMLGNSIYEFHGRKVKDLTLLNLEMILEGRNEAWDILFVQRVNTIAFTCYMLTIPWTAQQEQEYEKATEISDGKRV